MENRLSEKIHIGISACQFGAKVRYNSKGWDMTSKLMREKSEFIWHPVCPEVMSGLGVPRNPISLRGGDGNQFWSGEATIKDRGGKDLTKMVKEGALSCLETLKKADVDVFVYMEGSPSCGVYRTTLKNQRIGKPPGIFGSLLLKEELFLIPAVEMSSPIKWWDWRRRMYAFVWLKHKEISTLNELFETWHIIKFLCQELFRKESDLIGKKLASLSKKSFNETIVMEFRSDIMNMLRSPSDPKKIKQALWKNYSFLRKKYDLLVDEVLEPTDIRSLTKISKELVKVEIATKKENFLFGPTPIYR